MMCAIPAVAPVYSVVRRLVLISPSECVSAVVPHFVVSNDVSSECKNS